MWAQKYESFAGRLLEPRRISSVASGRVGGRAPGSGTGSAFSRSLRAVGWVDADKAHHAAVFVFEKMAVIHKSSDGIRIAKIHAQADAGILQVRRAVVGHVDRVAEVRLVDGDSIPRDQHEMQLVDVKGVQFRGAVLDYPVLDLTL